MAFDRLVICYKRKAFVTSEGPSEVNQVSTIARRTSGGPMAIGVGPNMSVALGTLTEVCTENRPTDNFP